MTLCMVIKRSGGSHRVYLKKKSSKLGLPPPLDPGTSFKGIVLGIKKFLIKKLWTNMRI